jgi:hypothetical protein
MPRVPRAEESWWGSIKNPLGCVPSLHVLCWLAHVLTLTLYETDKNQPHETLVSLEGKACIQNTEYIR